jgi:hypothetical protein
MLRRFLPLAIAVALLAASLVGGNWPTYWP